MKKNIIFFVLLISTLSIYSQKTEKLYMIKEIKNAIKNETRTHKGVAGANYFVNQIDYDIKISFNTKTRIVSGTETITYKNNSNDTLEKIVINLYQDVFKKGNARDWKMGDVDITDVLKLRK